MPCCTGRDALYVIEERAAGRPALVTDTDVRLPAHLTASGLAMLAALPPQQLRALYPTRDAFTERHGGGATTLTELRRELTEVRRDGFAQEIGLVSEDFATVACAVVDHHGYPLAAVAVTFPRADEPPSRQLIGQVEQTAAGISRRLGARTASPTGAAPTRTAAPVPPARP